MDLPQLVIHGDFGIHNLLFQPDGTAVVHDFELARLDWRLLDLVIAASRLAPARRGAFMAGYRETNELPGAEIDVLPALWRYHLLTGAVRSWYGYSEFGNVDRLATARARIIEAERVSSRGPVVWC